MKIITINYPRYLDNIRMGDRHYWFKGDRGPYEKGDYVVVMTPVGPACVMIESAMDSEKFLAAFASVPDLDALSYVFGHFQFVPEGVT